MTNVVDITLDNAQEQIIDESFKRLVMVDFWADWCGPCKSLVPVLEKLAQEYQGAFLLAKVNADQQQMLASQFGVRSLPTVMLIKDGQPLDGFAGAKSEMEVRALLDQYLPKAWEALVQQAQDLLAAEDAAGALPLLRQAYTESNQLPQIAILMAQVLVELKRWDEADELLGIVKLADQDALYEQVKAQLTLAREAAKSPEVAALEEALAADPNNLELTHQLAIKLNEAGQHRPALELLLKIVQTEREYADGQAKKLLLDIIASLGKGDPLAVEFQRKLFTLLY